MIMQAEFMEHDEKPLPIDIRLLGALADKVCFIRRHFQSLSRKIFLTSCLCRISSCLISCLSFCVVNTTFQCRAFAKALHYKEMEFEGARSKKMDANPVAVVEALIHINNQLHQHEVFTMFIILLLLPDLNLISLCINISSPF